MKEGQKTTAYNVARGYAKHLRAFMKRCGYKNKEDVIVLTAAQAEATGRYSNVPTVLLNVASFSMTGRWEIDTEFGWAEIMTEEQYEELTKGFNTEPYSGHAICVWED